MKIYKQPCPENVILYLNKISNLVLCLLFIKFPCVAAECVNYGDVLFNFPRKANKRAVSFKNDR